MVSRSRNTIQTHIGKGLPLRSYISISILVCKGLMKLSQDGFSQVPPSVSIGIQSQQNLYPVAGVRVFIGNDWQISSWIKVIYKI